MITRYSKNVPGDFYVEKGCCLQCGVPMTEAPEFFEMDETQCYIVRQPSTTQEIHRLVKAIATQEVGCIHYAGEDKAIIRSMTDNGDGDCCDSTSEFFARTIARFTHEAAKPEDFLNAFMSAVSKHAFALRRAVRFGKITLQGETAHLDLTLLDGRECSLSIAMLMPEEFRLHLRSDAISPGTISTSIHNMLSMVPVRNLCWMNQSEWDNGLGQPLP